MEMNFRKVVVALAVLTLFAGLASAQYVPPQSISCTVSADSTPSIRAEGLSEHVGDIIITCTAPGTTVATSGSAADRGQISVNFGVPIATKTVASGLEAMLVIDEPGTQSGSIPQGLFGSQGPIVVCDEVQNATAVLAAAGCPTFAYNNGTFWVANTNGLAAGTQAANAYQGVIGGTSGSNLNIINFNNVPVIPPGSTGVQRIYRITNVRVTPGSSAIAATVTATPNSGSTFGLTLANATATVATPVTGILPSLGSVTSAESLCVASQLYSTSPYTKANLAILTFKEGFSNAFKTRVLPLALGAGASEGTGATQTKITGKYTIGTTAYTSYNSESMTMFTLNGGGSVGLADTPTRLKAVFTNLDTKAKYYVSINNVVDFSTNATAPSNGGAGDQTNIPWAVLDVNQGITKEIDGSPVTAAASVGLGNNVVNVAQVTNTSGAGEVIWEIANDKTATQNSFNFALYVTYDPSAAASTPAVTTSANAPTVTLGFAPTNGTNGATATTPPGSTTTNIPRFTFPTAATSSTFFNAITCQTVLLFPYVTNNSNFETGMSISNTALDPFGTPQGAPGSCNMYFYGLNPSAGAVPFPPVAASPNTISAGQQYANTVSGLGLVNFAGYAIAVCNFQFAHGFAFVQTKAGTMAMGYLPLVMQTGSGTIVRGSPLVGESLTN
jgi:hypothetical protein